MVNRMLIVTLLLFGVSSNALAEEGMDNVQPHLFDDLNVNQISDVQESTNAGVDVASAPAPEDLVVVNYPDTPEVTN